MDIIGLQVSNEKGAKQNHPWEYARGVDAAFDREIISKLTSENNKYDIRFFNDIQSVTNLREASLASQKYISRDTIIAITVPAFNSLYCNHDKWLGHYRRYSHAMLKQHIETAGLSYAEGGYFFTSLLFQRYIQQKIIEKIKKPHKIILKNDTQSIKQENQILA